MMAQSLEPGAKLSPAVLKLVFLGVFVLAACKIANIITADPSHSGNKISTSKNIAFRVIVA